MTKSAYAHRSRVGSGIIVALVLSAAAGCTTAAAEETHGVVAAYTAPLSEAQCPGEDEDTAAARQAIARVRAMAGLSPLRCDAHAMAAAADHCAYVAANHVFSHIESPGHPSFTGVNFWDRLSAQAFEEAPASEVLANDSGEMAIDGEYGLMNSVYHRAAFLRAENTSFGYGHATACATIDFGTTQSTPSVRLLWPPNGATQVPTTFHANHETPNPMPGQADVGAPITMVGPGSLETIEATLEGPNGRVDATVITAKNDPAKIVRVGEAHLVPSSPLAPSTTYVARFVGSTYHGDAAEVEDASDRFELTTTFTTEGP